MKIREKEITDREMLEILNCPACLSVVNAIKLKQGECACSLYNAYFKRVMFELFLQAYHHKK